MLRGKNLKPTLRDTCQRTDERRRERGRAVARVLASLAAVALAACARTGLDPWDLEPLVDDGLATGGSGGSSSLPPDDASTAGMPPDAGELPDAGEPPDAEPPRCVPEPEACNERDDDCNGEVDDLPGVPCEGGGFRYCVAGRMSECPRSCEVCVPGSVRICQNSYCTFWGEQECAADGRGFGPCRERRPPPRCATIAARKHDSPELEQCCIDDGYCCLDEHDLDRDGSRRDMLGACDGVRCP
ncbi:MAG TPA: hypothetical protein VFZ53_32200 [Polyangiaceae bacterium]